MLPVVGMGLGGNLLLFSHGNDDLPTNHFWNTRENEPKTVRHRKQPILIYKLFTSEDNIPEP